MSSKVFIYVLIALIAICILGFIIIFVRNNSNYNASSNENESKLSSLNQNNEASDSSKDDIKIKDQNYKLEDKEENKMQIDKNKQYKATLKTSQGNIEIELFANKTPITVNNFVSLSKKDFYSDTIFHRVIEGFMIQGGDPKGDGTGGPGYQFDDEPFDGEYERGTIAMANAGPNTNGSQFFIMHQDYALPKNYVIFGKVISGIEVVDKIATAKVEQNRGEISKPVTPVKIANIEITETAK